MLINLTIPRLLDLDGTTVRLRPGLNDINPAAWAKVKDDPYTQHHLAAGEIVVVEEPAPEAPKGKGK